jgi:hypothetical protein
MTTVDILFRYATPPTESVAMALAGTRDVYGIRRLSLDASAKTLHVEYDATRLNAATVTRLMKQTGLEIEEQLALVSPAPPPAPVPAAPAA